MAATLLLSVNAYGAAPSGELTIHPVEHPVSVSSVNYKEDIVHATPRGEILSTGIVVINDNGDGTVTLTAKVYKAGADVTNTFSNRWFTWYAKSENGEKYIGYGYSITVDKDTVGFGSTYIGRFITYDTYYLTDRNGNRLTTRTGDRLTTWIEN